MSDMEGKVTRVGASERGQRTSFKTPNYSRGYLLAKAFGVSAANSGEKFTRPGPPCPPLDGLAVARRPWWACDGFTRVERGERNLSFKKLCAIAKTLGRDVGTAAYASLKSPVWSCVSITLPASS